MRERIKYKYQLEQDFQLPTGLVMSHVLRVWASFPNLLWRFLHDPFASGFYRDMIFTYCFPYYCTYSLFIFVFKNKMHYIADILWWYSFSAAVPLALKHNSIVLRWVKCCQGRWPGEFWGYRICSWRWVSRMELVAWNARCLTGILSLVWNNNPHV